MYSRAAKATPAFPISELYGYSTEAVPRGILPCLCSLLRNALILGLIVIFAVAILGYESIHNRLAVSPPNEGLRVPPTCLKCRQVNAETRVQWLLPIYNGSLRTLEVQDLNTNCAYASLAPRSFQVAPTATTVVLVTLNVPWAQNANNEESPQAFEVSIVPEIRDISHRLEGWKLPVEVLPPAEEDPSLDECGG